MAKLTPKQIKILQTLRDNPSAFVTYDWISAKWALWPEGTSGSPQRINRNLIDGLREHLVKLPYDRRQRDRYTVIR